MNILIAGASGYIGQALIPVLLTKYPEAHIYGLSRNARESSDPRCRWVECDLFSMKSLERAAPEKIDLAIYLVHSMGQTAYVDQGSFADFDLILADNFSRIMKARAASHVVYLGGLLPEGVELSEHLQSRLEVEQTFHFYNLPLTIFRAGLIVGAEGSSFQILKKLVSRLPLMICPSWTQTLTAPVDLTTVVNTLAEAGTKPETIGRQYDLAGCKPLSYVEMMRETANQMGLHRKFYTVPFFTPTLSRLWVSLISGAPRGLVYPLVESLKSPMVPRKDHLYNESGIKRSYAEIVGPALKDRPVRTKQRWHLHLRRIQLQKTVRSVQRLPMPENRDAIWVKDEYFRWLPRTMLLLVRVFYANDIVKFCLLSPKIVLLELTLDRARSSNERQLLYITSGLMAEPREHGRLEFRSVLDKRFCLAAIHDFKPRLPWFIYKYSQARVHVWVMRRFGAHLKTFEIPHLKEERTSHDSVSAHI